MENGNRLFNRREEEIQIGMSMPQIPNEEWKRKLFWRPNRIWLAQSEKSQIRKHNNRRSWDVTFKSQKRLFLDII